MRSKKKYFRKILRKRFVDLVLLVFMFYLIMLIVYFPLIRCGKGTLVQYDWIGWGKIWLIDTGDNNDNRDRYIRIGNAGDFSDILKSENEGKDVFYFDVKTNRMMNLVQDHVEFLDLFDSFNQKFTISIFLTSIIISPSIIYIYIKRKDFLITNKLLS